MQSHCWRGPIPSSTTLLLYGRGLGRSQSISPFSTYRCFILLSSLAGMPSPVLTWRFFGTFGSQVRPSPRVILSLYPRNSCPSFYIVSMGTAPPKSPHSKVWLALACNTHTVQSGALVRSFLSGVFTHHSLSASLAGCSGILCTCPSL